jgi:hypothetical protein
LGKDGLGRTFHHNYSPFHDDQPVGQGGNLRHVVGDKDHSQLALFLQPLNLPEHILPTPGIQTSCRFIQHQYRRFHGQNPGYGNPPLFTSAELKGRTFRQGHINIHRGQSPFHSGTDFLIG